MPLPPPPAAALISRGVPIFAASAASFPASSASAEGARGTQCFSAKARAFCLSPISSMASASGPTQISPASFTARAKRAFSDRKPKPGWMASAPADFAAAMIWSMSR